MDKEKMLERYSSRYATLFKDELSDDSLYRVLIQRKLATEKELRQAIGDEEWKRYLELDEACNELESLRYKTMYLAGAADYEKLFVKS